MARSEPSREEARKDLRDMYQRAREKGPFRRTPRFVFGERLRDPYGFVGTIDSMYSDYWAAVASHVIPAGWYSIQEKPPVSKDQVFYGLVGPGGDGAVVVGEAEAEFVSDETTTSS